MECVIVHGLGQNPSSWNKITRCLHEDVQVNCPDFTAWLAQKDFIYSNLYSAFKEYCNTKNEPLHLCGLSLGAILALNYAVDYPDRVGSLVLIAPQYKMPVFLLKVQAIIFHFMPKSSFVSSVLTKENTIRLTKSMQRLDFSENLRNIMCPVLVICGEHDFANKKGGKHYLILLMPRFVKSMTQDMK